MNTFQDCGVVLAAAGRSRRFGDRDKLLIPFQGRPLFEHALLCFARLRLAQRVETIQLPGATAFAADLRRSVEKEKKP